MQKIMEFTNFLESTRSLAHLDDQNFPKIFNELEVDFSSPNTFVYVGTGDWGGDILYRNNFPYKSNGKYIVLNHKGMPGDCNLRFESVTDFVLAAPEEVVKEWKRQLSDGPLGFSCLNEFSLILEDASPDTCFAISVFFARLAGVNDFPKNWVKYIRQWELGDVHSTGEYKRSWAALQSALTHSYFRQPPAEKTQPPAEKKQPPSKEELCLALRAGLRLLSDALTENIEPNLVPNEMSSVDLIRARQFQIYEKQIYDQSLRSVTTIELSLPMANSERKMLMSAYIAKEAYAFGAIKILARQDPNTLGGLGYGLMALFRSFATGTGNDMVISVDPARGVALKELWEKLESLEESAWKGERPCDNPRRIDSYLIENNETQNKSKWLLRKGAPNQPWYDGKPIYTLIAAPRNLEGGQKGSRLTWDQVIDALFELYNPVRDMCFKNSSTAEVGSLDIKSDPSCEKVDSLDINALRMAAKTESIKSDPTRLYRFIEAHWPEKEEQGYLLCDTVWRYFAACIKYPKETHITPYNLPKSDEYDLVPVVGGTVLVHAQGVFALNDWSWEQLPMEDVKEEFQRAIKIMNTLNEIRSEIKEIINSENKNKNRVKRLSKIRDRLLNEEVEQQAHAVKPEFQMLRETIERRLSLSQRISELSKNILEMHDNLVSRATAKTNRIIEFLTIFGFPAIFFASFFQNIVQNVNFFGLDDSSGLHYGGLIAYLLITGLGMLIIYLIIRYMGAKDARNNSE